MNNKLLLDLAVELGYQLAMCGAETYRVEESITRVLASYGIASETFAIANCLTVSIETPDGVLMTRMRRIGAPSNDLDAVERYSGLSRRICSQHPAPETALQWLQETGKKRVFYTPALQYLGSVLGSSAFSFFYGGTLADAVCAGFCGIIGCWMGRVLERLHVNQFFKTIITAFSMALPAYLLAYAGIAASADATIIGCLMMLVPGLLFTNAMRDIIFGDTNCGIQRLVQVLLIALAIALGTGAAWNVTGTILATPETVEAAMHGVPGLILACAIGCVGFCILFNIHGPGIILCALGGVVTWFVYDLFMKTGYSEITACFWGCFIAALYAEGMARLRKYPAISYLVVSIFTLLPGAGVYYTMNYAVRGDMTRFSSQGAHTMAVAGSMAVGILLVSTLLKLTAVWKAQKKKKK